MSARRNFEWPELLTADGRGIAFGGDYNPDQWSEDIWDDDIRLMKQAGVNTVALANGGESGPRTMASLKTWRKLRA